MRDNIFFAKNGDKGLTETSASHLCAVASQVKAQYEEVLNNVSFIDTYMDIVGSNSSAKQTGTGMKNLDDIDNAIDVISRMNTFISWFAEGRTAIENERNYINGMSVNTWVDIVNYERLTEPTRASMKAAPTMDDVIETLSIADRQKYLELEAKASVFGQFIHKGKPMDVARKNMFHAVSSPCTTTGESSNIIIKTSSPSVDTKLVDDKFNKLQFDYRQIEKELNQMKAMLRDKLNDLQTAYVKEKEENNLRFAAEQAQYNAQMQTYNNELASWKTDELAKLSKTRIVLPHHLEETYNYLSNLK